MDSPASPSDADKYLARRRDLRMAATVLGAAILLLSAIAGLLELYERGTESQSWAEGRCARVDPDHPTGSQA